MIFCTGFIWAHKVVWISYRPSEPVTGVRIPMGPFIIRYYLNLHDYLSINKKSIDSFY